MFENIFPKRPHQLPLYSELCCQCLSENNLAHTISLGGAFGLLHYLDYRSTTDVDAWWVTYDLNERQAVVEAIEKGLKTQGDVKVRYWGQVVSVELQQTNKTIFSFQIAERSIQLEPSQPISWTDLKLDSLSDLVASKMTALVERGAPRDFRDIYELCHANLLTIDLCWFLWEQRQSAIGNNGDRNRARLAISTHLNRIIRHRPLEKIDDFQQKTDAEKLRNWFHSEFLSNV